MLCKPPLDEASEEIPIQSDSSVGEALPPQVSFFPREERNEHSTNVALKRATKMPGATGAIPRKRDPPRESAARSDCASPIPGDPETSSG